MSAQSFIFNPREDRIGVAGNGFTLPRMTTQQRLQVSVSSGDAGMMVFDLDFGLFYGWNGASWMPITGSGTPIFTSGIGSPEGVVTAPTPALYWDVTNPAEPVQYFKTTPTGNTGWI